MSYCLARKPVRIQALARSTSSEAQRAERGLSCATRRRSLRPTTRRPAARFDAPMSLADQWARLCAELQCSGAVRAKGDEMLTRLTDDRLESSQARLAARAPPPRRTRRLRALEQNCAGASGAASTLSPLRAQCAALSPSDLRPPISLPQGRDVAHGRLAAAAYMSSQELGTPVSVRLLVKHLSLHIKVRALPRLS